MVPKHRGKIKRIIEMRNTISMCLILGLSISFAYSDAQSMSARKILIVYLSRTNNTKAVAEIIQRNVGGTLVALELEKPYPENYQQTVQQVVKENETGYLPPLKTKIDSIEKYDVVFTGFPTWDMHMPPPMKSFLHQYNLSGKTVIPFNTNAGYGVGSGFQTVKELCPNSKVLEGFSITGGIERDGVYLAIEGEKAKEAEKDVKKWLQKIKLSKEAP
jgi:flavodoxin